MATFASPASGENNFPPRGKKTWVNKAALRVSRIICRQKWRSAGFCQEYLHVIYICTLIGWLHRLNVMQIPRLARPAANWLGSRLHERFVREGWGAEGRRKWRRSSSKISMIPKRRRATISSRVGRKNLGNADESEENPTCWPVDRSAVQKFQFFRRSLEGALR